MVQERTRKLKGSISEMEGKQGRNVVRNARKEGIEKI